MAPRTRHACSRRLAFIAVLWLLASPLPEARTVEIDVSAESFARDLENAEVQAARGHWTEARKALLDLLELHAGADYVRPELPELRVAIRRAAFWQAHERPEVKDLISGQLVSYSAARGTARLVYGNEDMADFERIANFRLHPIHFRDTYTIELEGLADEICRVGVLVGMSERSGYLVQPGDRVEGASDYTLHQVQRLDSGTAHVLEAQDPKERKASRRVPTARLKVVVSEARIKVSYNGKMLFELDNDEKRFGQVGLFGSSRFEQLTIDGKVEIGWFEDLIDASVQDDWKAFEAQYEEPEAFDAWGALPQTVRTSRDLAKLAAQLEFPEDLTLAQASAATEITEMIQAGDPDEVVIRLDEMGPELCPPATREFLLVMNWLHASRYETAWTHAQRLTELIEPSQELRMIGVLLCNRTERWDESICALEELLDVGRDDPGLYAELAEILLLLGRPEEARERVDAGLALSPADEDLGRLRVQLAKATRGPAWKRPHVAEVEHFVVASDLNPRLSRIVARHAQMAHEHYAARFGALSADSPKIDLYLFSGSTSYTTYIDGVADASLESTLGVFSPLLKQVLLWNQPDRAGLLRVVRHEVMHAYMDRALQLAPIFLNEGVAEYFAQSWNPEDGWREGSGGKELLEQMKPFGLRKISVERLLHMGHTEFMHNANYTYPMSWAFVKFSLQTTPENRKRFEELWKLLEGSINPDQAVREVFAGVDMGTLNREFWKFVKKELEGL